MQNLSFLDLMRSASDLSCGSTPKLTVKPLCVSIETHQGLFVEALRSLLENRGIRLETELHSATAVAIIDVGHRRRPYPKPPADTPTLALVSEQDDDLAALITLGFRGYVRTNETPETLLRALTAVHRGEVWAEREVLAETLVEPRPSTLTRRQHEVLALLADGHSNREIAARLGISVSTVKAHVTSLLEKYKADSRLELVSRHLKAEQ